MNGHFVQDRGVGGGEVVVLEVCGRGTTKRVARSEVACGEPFSGLGGVRPVECGLEQRYVALGLYSGQDHPHLTEVDLRFRVEGPFLRDEYVVPPPGLQADLMRTSARDRLGYPVDRTFAGRTALQGRFAHGPKLGGWPGDDGGLGWMFLARGSATSWWGVGAWRDVPSSRRSPQRYQEQDSRKPMSGCLMMSASPESSQ